MTDLIHALFEEAKLGYDIQMVPWSRVLIMMEKSANILAYSMARTKEREQLYHWIGEILAMKIYLYGLSRDKQYFPKTLIAGKDILRYAAFKSYLQLTS